MNTFVFTSHALKRFMDLPKPLQERVSAKLQELKVHPDLLSVLKRLHHLAPATHRLRIGDLRVVLEKIRQDKDGMSFFVLDVGDRKDIYR